MDAAHAGMRQMRWTWGRDGCGARGDMMDVADVGTRWMQRTYWTRWTMDAIKDLGIWDSVL